ncbi:Cu(I)-responsive transcriptional regulator [Acinetobacter rathckeae]|uniref:Cu(I)-responsive transcriptional regulator n=1 Tax=Acinetobacter rathckeae TaxID=2605272 RepID=UPI0018A298B4|nr:Cu(I)-responsive transcriptional regulator [Acinetobacter rathckeae]MBF7687342.1 Cu(I)-responsive transcriptional regulator [Acinetobacter rathckeae]MBF7694743.1 Cu(I)-responsive transcriptional regulator [Acinetobacter rathckeae]
MNIGQVSKRLGLSSKMIRYYESVGLLTQVERSSAGYRIYHEKHIETLQFILHAKALHFSTEQMKYLLQLWQNQTRHSADVKAFAQAHIGKLNAQIQQLEGMVSLLKQAVSCCAGNTEADCPILDKIAQGKTQAST